MKGVGKVSRELLFVKSQKKRTRGMPTEISRRPININEKVHGTALQAGSGP